MRLRLLQLGAATLIVVLAAGAYAFGHEETAFGQPGNASKSSRPVHVTMVKAGRKLLFVPDTIEVKKEEQIRFVVDNEDIFNHEFVLGTERGIASHALEMKKHPSMQHDDAHSLSVAPYMRGELLWRFTKAGRFVFACLIPGHLERGMRGTIVVK